MLTTSKFVNFKKGLSRWQQPVSTNVQCPNPSVCFEQVEKTEAEAAPIPTRLEELLGKADPLCLDDIFSDLISDHRQFGLCCE